MKSLVFAVMAVFGVYLVSSCRSQAAVSGGRADKSAFEAGRDRSLINSEERLAGQVVHYPPENRVHIIGGTPVNAIPKAVAFKMSGDYAEHVPMSLNPDGTLASYPAPTDITANSAPIELSGGWWLDRCGVSSSTVFSRYTLAEYAALESAPSPAEMVESIIPGARVTVVERLSMTPSEAVADTVAVNVWLRSHSVVWPGDE